MSRSNTAAATRTVDIGYDEESFFVLHAYFLGANDPYSALKTTLKAEIDDDASATLHRDSSRPFPKPTPGRIAVKVINHLGDEVRLQELAGRPGPVQGVAVRDGRVVYDRAA